MDYLGRERKSAAVVIGAIIAGVIFLGVLFWAFPQYRVYSQRLAGQAELERAEFNRRIAIEEARASLESADHLANAEVRRAQGVAQANAIIGESLEGNEAYLRYLWIQGLQDSNGETVYIPTEAGMPILEAGRFSRQAVSSPAE